MCEGEKTQCYNHCFSLSLQFIQRLKVMMMARKNQPDLVYLRQIPILTAYLFTILQLISLCLLWPFRMTVAAVIFPFMVCLYMCSRTRLYRIRDITNPCYIGQCFICFCLIRISMTIMFILRSLDSFVARILSLSARSKQGPI